MHVRNALLICFVTLALACQKLGSPAGDSGGPNGSHAGGAVGSGGHGGSSGHAGGNSSAGSAGEPITISTVLALNSASAHVVGRSGDAVRFTLEGTQARTEQALAVAVTFSDAGGAPVLVFDSDWDGQVDSASGRVVFDTKVLDVEFSAVATLAGIDTSHLSKATLAVLDATGSRTDSLTVAVAAQERRVLGQACDRELVDNRCEAGQSCTGAPAVCTSGVAPALEELRYLRGPNGPILLARGTDPDDDLATLHLDFMDGASAPVLVDLDNDGIRDSASFDIDASRASQQGLFFLSNQSASGFELLVPRIAVTPLDANGNIGVTEVTDIANLALKTAGLVCDPRGFTACATGLACSPGVDSVQNTCAVLTRTRPGACAAKPALEPNSGIRFAAGRVERMSMWDAPAGCIGGDLTGLPDSVVPLHLANPAKTLTLTTARPETTFDTALYVLPGCPNDASAALGCNDDTTGYTSSLVLKDVPAGDYVIVVESLQMQAGSYGLEVTVE